MVARYITRREFLTLLAAGTAGAYLAGCGPAATPTAAPAPTPIAPLKPQFDPKKYKGETIFFAISKVPRADVLVQNMREFEDWTGIKVEYEVVPEAQIREQNVIRMTAKDTQMDVWEAAYGPEMRRFSKMGWMQPLDDYLKDPTLADPSWDPEDINPAGRKLWTGVDGKLYGLNTILPSMIYACRKDLLEAKGLKFPKTLEEMENAAKALHDPPNRYGIVLRGKGASTVIWGAIFQNMGGTWLDKDRKLTLTSPEAIKAVELYARLLRNYGPPGVTGYDWMECSSLFLQGKAAMWIDGADLVATAEDPKTSTIVGKVGYSPTPAGAGGQFLPVSGPAMCISPFSKKKEAAFLFCQWATNKKNHV
ncbi:MAG: sugar ABC transporter substrate-binding protein, partial [Chloroflexi bacterium]|nr:sugar ABC transporter substrate-binding protein [Chloroflexota bacterium]